MRALGIYIILSCTVAYVYAAVKFYPPETKPEEFASQPGCYIRDLERVLPYNEPYSREGKCEEFTCRTDNYTQLATCGIFAVDGACDVTFNKELEYPGCCDPIVVCDPTTEVPTTTTEASCSDEN